MVASGLLRRRCVAQSSALLLTVAVLRPSLHDTCCFMLSGLSRGISAFSQQRVITHRRHGRCIRLGASEDEASGTASGSRAAIAVLPIGPFCPFRSTFTESASMDTEMATISRQAQSLSARFAPIALEAQLGKTPDPEVVRPLAQEMKEASKLWKVVLGRMRMTQDFQGLEFYKVTEAQVARRGMTMQQVEDLMTWQMEGMLAFCEGRPEPPYPPGLSYQMLQKMQSDGPSALSNMLGSSARITASPFDMNCAAMQSPVVREEFEKLRDDHKGLIKFGESYGDFDAAGKEMFLDQVALIESRWDTFMARFSLLGQVNPQFIWEAQAYLDKVRLTPREFNVLLQEAHQRMRKDAETEALTR